MIILLAGPTATGKTSVASQLAVEMALPTLSARRILLAMTGTPQNRVDLQRVGAEIDRNTNGRWILEHLADHYLTTGALVDAMRTRRQTEPVLESIPDSRLIYLDATESVRRRRYEAAQSNDEVKRSTPFDTAERHPTEQHVIDLKPLAHLVVQTDDLAVEEVVAECRRFLGVG